MSASGSLIRGQYTLSEILSQPEAWKATLAEFAGSAAIEDFLKRAVGQPQWLFVGCGTSFYLAEAAAASWTMLTGERARAVPASEILLFPQLAQLNAHDVRAVVISRSGSTSEAIRAAEALGRTNGVATLGVTCTPGSELTRVCEATMVITSADEKSVVMTRSFTTMLLGLLLLAANRHRFGRALAESVVTTAKQLAARINDFSDRIEGFVAKHSLADYIYLAQGPFFPVAREAALKITEMSCSYAQSYHTLEFRHGPKSIVSPQTCLTFFLSESGMPAESEVLAEMKELGGTVVTVCNRATEAVRRSSDLLFEMESDVPEVAQLAPFVVPAQLLGYHTGIKKGFDPDEPKNLSRVVILN